MTMKIGFLLPSEFAVGNPYNGIREQAYYQISALRRLGVDIVMLNPWEKQPMKSLDCVHFFAGGPSLAGVSLKTPDPIARLVFSPILDTLAPYKLYRLSALLGAGSIPKLRTIQGYYREQANASKIVIVRSRYEADLVQYGLGIEKAKIRIVLNGAPLQEVEGREVVPDRFNISEPFALHISRITNKNKNVLSLIEAVGPTGISLVIAGTADDSAYLDKINLAISRYDNVSYVGQVSEDEKRYLYHNCELFCLPSRFEGTGLVALEAAMCGSKILITRNGGPPDYFGEHAVYTEKGSVEEIRLRFIEAWSAASSQALRDHVRAELTWERSADSLVSIYRELIE